MSTDPNANVQVRIVFKVSVAPASEIAVEYGMSPTERDRLMQDATGGSAASGVYDATTWTDPARPRKLFVRFADVLYIG